MCLEMLYAVFLLLDPLTETSWMGHMYTKANLRSLFEQKAEGEQILSAGGMGSSSGKDKAGWERANVDIMCRHALLLASMPTMDWWHRISIIPRYSGTEGQSFPGLRLHSKSDSLIVVYHCQPFARLYVSCS